VKFAYLAAAALTVLMVANVLLWKRAGSPVDHDRKHDPVPVTVAGAIAAFTTGITLLMLLWWVVEQALSAWRSRGA